MSEIESRINRLGKRTRKRSKMNEKKYIEMNKDLTIFTSFMFVALVIIFTIIYFMSK